MARNRFDNLDPWKQEAILKAAGEEFAEKGFEAASINRIIKKSGMSKGSVYYYFEDKADLFTTTLERSLQRLVDEIGWLSLEVLGPDEFWDALLELTHRSVDWARRDDWWVRLGKAYHRLRQESGAGASMGRLFEFGRSRWKAIIDRGQVLGVIRTDLPQDLLVEIVMGADEGGDRWMMEHWDESSGEVLKRIVDARVDLLRDMLDKENEGWER
ncbi:MAG: TetR/AcrR family transcriptional regulator [Longimicrobiales bacterium]|nr:TetR/AcrR family transcriptional regulator [Longimicrobiales bacterium]